MYTIHEMANGGFELRSPDGGYLGIYANAMMAEMHKEAFENMPPHSPHKDRRAHARGGRRRTD